MNINKVTLSGNLTRGAQLRATAGGTPVLSLGLAVGNRRKNQKTGAWEDEPYFFDCVLYGARAEKLAPMLSKGTHVAVEGKLIYRAWEAKDGSRRSKVEVLVDEIDFLAPKAVKAGAVQEEPMGIEEAAAYLGATKVEAMGRGDHLYDEDVRF